MTEPTTVPRSDALRSALSRFCVDIGPAEHCFHHRSHRSQDVNSNRGTAQHYGKQMHSMARRVSTCSCLPSTRAKVYFASLACFSSFSASFSYSIACAAKVIGVIVLHFSQAARRSTDRAYADLETCTHALPLPATTARRCAHAAHQQVCGGLVNEAKALCLATNSIRDCPASRTGLLDLLVGQYSSTLAEV